MLLKKSILKYINNDIEISSDDSDNENSDEENSREENSDTENLDTVL